MNVGGATSIVTGESGLELCDTVNVGLLNAAVPGVVDVALVGRVTVALRNDTGINAGGVAVPHLKIDVGDGLASVNIDNLVVKNGGYTFLAFHEVTTDPLSTNIIRALGDLGGQDARAVTFEKGSGISVESVSLQGGVVVGGNDSVKVALCETTFCARFLEGSFATSSVALVITTSLQLGSAVAKIRAFNRAEIFSALRDFLGDVMAWMS